VVIPRGTSPAVASGTVTIHGLQLEGSLELDGTFSATNVVLDGGALTGHVMLSVGRDHDVSAEGVLAGDVDALGGTLQVTLVNGYVPAAGTPWDVFTWAGSLTTTDQFANSLLIGPAGNIAHTTKYNANSVSFSI
jgi:hypothetical protein